MSFQALQGLSIHDSLFAEYPAEYPSIEDPASSHLQPALLPPQSQSLLQAPQQVPLQEPPQGPSQSEAATAPQYQQRPSASVDATFEHGLPPQYAEDSSLVRSLQSQLKKYQDKAATLKNQIRLQEQIQHLEYKNKVGGKPKPEPPIDVEPAYNLPRPASPGDMEQYNMPSGNTSLRCRHWSKGFCWYGTSCSFLHVGPPVAMQHCRHWITKGYCLHKQCSFKHDVSAKAAAAPAADVHTTTMYNPPSSHPPNGSAGQTPHHSERAQYSKKGNCMYGDGTPHQHQHQHPQHQHPQLQHPQHQLVSHNHGGPPHGPARGSPHGSHFDSGYSHGNPMRNPPAPFPSQHGSHSANQFRGRVGVTGVSAEICRHWARKGHCNLGNQCNFMHPVHVRSTVHAP